MNCWAILALEPGADRSDIKRAYARKLKVTRPDVDPEGFKQLHTAYKLALGSAGVPAGDFARPESRTDIGQLRRSKQGDSCGDPRTSGDEVAAAEAAEPSEIIPPDVGIRQEAAATSIELQRERDDDAFQSLAPIQNLALLERQLVDRIDTVLRDTSRAMNAAPWTFLEECEELQDIQLRSEISLYLFGRLVEQPVLLKGRCAAVEYLNDFFGWTDAIDVLADAYGLEATAWLHPLDARLVPKRPRWVCPRIHTGPLEWGGYYRRIGATLLDLLMVGGVVAGGSQLASLFGGGDVVDPTLLLLLTVGAYMLYAALFEASPLQGTLGKIVLGLKVTTPKGRRANIFLTLWRILMFAASTAAIKITVWINFFINDGRLLHDRLSRTVVVKRF